MKKLFPGETGGINEINTNEEIESQKNWLIKLRNIWEIHYFIIIKNFIGIIIKI